MSDAIKKFAIFTLAVIAFVAVRLVTEEWLYFTPPLSMALGFLVMGVIIKPLAAPDLPMSRWIIVPLAGATIGLVVLMAPRWYERWATTLPDYLPTEEQFFAQVKYMATGPSGEETPVDCGDYGPQQNPAAGVRCAMEAMEAKRPFYLVYAHAGWESGFARQALVASTGGAYRIDFFLDTRRVPPFSAIYHTLCRDPRFVEETTRAFLQCGPWPTSLEFQEEVRVGKDCGSHQGMHAMTLASTRERIECAESALEAREAFYFRFETDWGGDRGAVRGTLSWGAEELVAPVLSYYLRDDQSDNALPRLIQRACEAPEIRLVAASSATQSRSGSNSSIEIDCGGAGPAP